MKRVNCYSMRWRSSPRWYVTVFLAQFLCAFISGLTSPLIDFLQGPCAEPKPWGWNVVNNAKWQSWKQLGDMSKMEAMRLFVRTLEEEVPEWWSPDLMNSVIDASTTPSRNESNESTEKETNGESGKLVVKRRSVAEVLVEGSWVSPYIDDSQRPTPRYEHSVALVGNLLFLMGGNYAGRYIADTWCLDLETLAWSKVSASESGVNFPPSAGHAAVTYNGNVLLIGGHERLERVKGKVKEFSAMKVYSLSSVSKEWSEVETTCDEVGPLQRGGHSATLLGTKLFVFGGENPNRKPTNELWVLDLLTMTWSCPDVGGEPPMPRSSHSAVTYLERYIVIFGGGSVANCYNDLFVLDTQTMMWLCPEISGPVPPERAGHASAVLGSLMYLIGGGNNAKGCADMYSLELKNIGSEDPLEWTLIGNTPPESAIASEGLSLVCVPMAGCLLSFGGYNGKYHSAIHVYRPENYVLETLQELKRKSAPRDEPEKDAKSIASNDSSAALEAEASRREAAARQESTSLELSIMRKQLESSNKALERAEKIAEAAREALAEEEQKNMHLQVEIAELKKEVEKVCELERELQRYRQRDAGEPKKTGFWGYIAGSDTASQ